MEALSDVHKKLEVLSFFPITTVVEQDQAAMTVVVNVKERATGKRVTFLAAHFWRFRNGRIVDYRSIIDSLDAVRQMSEDTNSASFGQNAV